MLNDDDAINDVNPFVSRDFSLPGGVRKTGDFADFTEIRPGEALYKDTKSVYCGYGLCEDELAPLVIPGDVHPKRNIDCGYTHEKEIVVKPVVVGVAKKPRFLEITLIILFLLLLFFVVR
jgi:hypothetical protein